MGKGSELGEFGSGASILSEWKQIARHLGKGVRTAQRWERDLGLPVRRTQNHAKGGVIAFVAEIDHWVRARQFRGGGLVFHEPERVAILLALLENLRRENRELRHQLEARVDGLNGSSRSAQSGIENEA